MQIKYHLRYPNAGFQSLTPTTRVRTLTGKEIELDIEPDYKVRPPLPPNPQHLVLPSLIYSNILAQ